MTFNGEIYNFMEIRDRLQRGGATFRSRSDTEVLPNLFEGLDPGPLSTLNGMFAFGVWRPDLRELLLARDAFGKKPLYVYQDESFFAFASEMQAFYALPTFDCSPIARRSPSTCCLGISRASRTIYRRVRALILLLEFDGERVATPRGRALLPLRRYDAPQRLTRRQGRAGSRA